MPSDLMDDDREHSMRPYLLIATFPVPELGVEAGDVVIVDPDSPEPLTLCRELTADYAAVRRALAAGQLRASDPERPLPAELETDDGRRGTRAPEEPSAFDLLGGWTRAYRRLCDTRHHAAQQRTRSCRDCGADFKGPSVATVRCPSCRAAKR
jgi:hypothetical protein